MFFLARSLARICFNDSCWYCDPVPACGCTFDIAGGGGLSKVGAPCLCDCVDAGNRTGVAKVSLID